ASGANSRLQPSDVEAAKGVIVAADILLLQLESPLETVTVAAQIAAAHGVQVVLNPAPAQPLAPALLKHLTMITPNEVETEMLTGIKIEGEKSRESAALVLRSRGIATAIITLGARGVFVANEKGHFLSPAFKVKAVDTTAAGDIFNGALTAFLSRHRSIDEAVQMAGAAAALSVTKLGAQASAPHLIDIQHFLKEHA
ncbi:MAG: PfkB family carbohydrate kinase, partial [bacterium]